MKKWFGPRLIKWYELNKRELPWRNEKDPYKIWLSEIILQQTQVKQGLAYYLRFIETFPNVKDLAKANEDKVLKLWQGLGYYSRARNLHHTAQTIESKHKGRFPSDHKDISNLKGVGTYTAAAISSFAFNAGYAVVDGNVYRLLSRVFGIDSPIDNTIGKQTFQKLATELLDQKNPGIYNQAIMEFGSQYCKPKQPACNQCIFTDKCYAQKTNSVELFPVKSKKTKVSERHFNYLVISDKDNNIRINKRKENDIWKGLYEFELVETDVETPIEKMVKTGLLKSAGLAGADLVFVSKKYVHQLTHQKLFARFYVYKLPKQWKKQTHKIRLSRLESLAFPRLIEKFINDCDLKELL